MQGNRKMSVLDRECGVVSPDRLLMLPRMDLEKSAQPSRRIRISAGWIAGLVLLGALCASVGWQFRDDLLALAEQLRETTLEWLRRIPLPLYFLSFVLLPAVGMPLSLYYLTVGSVVGNLWLALLYSLIGLAGNMLVSFWLARGIFHPVIVRIVSKRGFTIPSVTKGQEWKWVLLFRASPVPWMLQNYIVALGGVPLGLYIWLSLAVQGVYATVMIFAAQSIMAGNFKYAMIGVFGFVVLTLAISVLRKRLTGSGTSAAR